MGRYVYHQTPRKLVRPVDTLLVSRFAGKDLNPRYDVVPTVKAGIMLDTGFYLPE
jgi:hypothetical protein